MRTGFDYADIMDEIIERAFGETSTSDDIISAKRSMYMVLEDWHAQQFNTWRVKSIDTGFAAGVALVPLPLGLDDVLEVTSIERLGEVVNENPMTRVSETEYAQIANKATAGRPSQYTLRRTEPPRLACYPAGRLGQTEILRVTYIERPSQFDRNGTDLDAPARWLNPLILGVAADLASKNPERAKGRIPRLDAAYARALDIALKNDRQRNSFKMRIR